MWPRPSTAEPSEITATLFFFIDIVRVCSGCFASQSDAAPTPGVYQSEKSFFPASFTRALVSMRAPCLLNASIIFFVFVSIVKASIPPLFCNQKCTIRPPSAPIALSNSLDDRHVFWIPVIFTMTEVQNVRANTYRLRVVRQSCIEHQNLCENSLSQ